MKNTIFCCLLSLFCFACGQNTPPVPAAAPEEKAPVAENTTVEATEPEAEVYLADEFLTLIAKTQSPYAVRNKTSAFPLLGFSYTPEKLSGFTSHEGGYDSELTLDKNTGKYSGKAIAGLEPFEFVVEADGGIKLTFLKSKKTYSYHKVRDVDYAVRKVLFEGTYSDNKTKAQITFQADGTLTGMGSEKQYLPFYDFMGPLSFDEMEVSEKGDDSKRVFYHYKFTGKKLEIYETKAGQDGDDKVGQLLHTLTKSEHISVGNTNAAQ